MRDCRKKGAEMRDQDPSPPRKRSPRSIPRLDTNHPIALKRKRVTNIKDQLRFN